VEYILEHFDQKTRRNTTYMLKDRRVSGFNSILATASIDAAKRYYEAFSKAQAEKPSDQRLKIATIFSYAPNEEDPDGLLSEEGFETDAMDKSSREFLETAMVDYNSMFATNFDSSGDSFQNYYKDLSGKLKSREIDLVIVVNMFLTGFDSTTLNTLWVDKNLRQHGLIQAYSRTNRILNSVKTYGNIVAFRDLEGATQAAISLFGNKEAGGIVLLKPYQEYYDEYSSAVEELAACFAAGEPPSSEAEQKEFIKLFNTILRLKNILVSFDDFRGNEILSPREFQDFQSTYMEIYSSFKGQVDADKESIIQDLVFEIELIKQVEINVDYILLLVKKLQESGADRNANREIKANISRAVDSSYNLRSKRDLIENFVNGINVNDDVDRGWTAFIAEQRASELEQIIENESLDPAATHLYVERAFRDGQLLTAGTALAKLLPPKPMFTANDEHGAQKLRLISLLEKYFDRFLSL
jgi:type I restriction enzyme R subunit